MENATLLEADAIDAKKWFCRVVQIEPNGTRHVMSDWIKTRGEAEAKRLAIHNSATLTILPASA